jgi:integrase
MCRDAASSKIEALRVRADNPTIGVAPPERGASTSKQYLYPSEFSTFIACPKVPIAWRRSTALAVYLYPRAGELRALAWEDVDLDHGTILIHQAVDRETGGKKSTKTKHSRRFAIEPALLPLLAVMKREAGGTGPVCTLPSERDMARGLRRWLHHANVRRAELHTSTPTRKAMTWHDLRATGATWMAVRGDDPLKIMQRCGHEDFATTQGYVREAEAIRVGFGLVFPTLPVSLLTGESDRSLDQSRARGRFLSRRNYSRNFSGADGTRTRGLRRDRPAL